MPEREKKVVPITIRIGESRRKALQEAIKKLPYVTTQAALFDRAVDLLIADMKKKGEIK